MKENIYNFFNIKFGKSDVYIIIFLLLISSFYFKFLEYLNYIKKDMIYIELTDKMLKNKGLIYKKIDNNTTIVISLNNHKCFFNNQEDTEVEYKIYKNNKLFIQGIDKISFPLKRLIINSN